MVGMETLRCPTCVAILPDPDARRCPLCHAKLRKGRSRPIVLGESNRLSGRSLPVDTELRVRAEERFEPFEPFASKAKRKSEPVEPVEAVIAFAPTEPEATPEVVAPAPVAAVPEIVLAEFEHAVTEPGIAEPEIIEREITADEISVDEVPAAPEASIEPEPAPVAANHFLDPELRKTAPVPAPIDLTEPEPIDLTEYEPVADTQPSPTTNGTGHAEPEPDPRAVRPASRWQAVPARTATSPFDGTLNDMVEELHRKARGDVGDSR